MESNLVMRFMGSPASDTSSISTTNNADISSVRGNSFLMVLSFSFIGFIRAATPSIRSMFKIQLPITFPSTISEL